MLEGYHKSLSKKDARKLGMRIRKDEHYLESVIELIQMKVYPESAKAAWVLRTASDARPSLMGSRVPQLLELIRSTPFSGARRDLMKCVLNLSTMKSYAFNENEGNVLDMCFERLNAIDSAVAERYYAMQMLSKFAKKYPEIIPEVISSAEMQLENGTDSFRKMTLKRITELEALSLKSQ